jgi:hypothetical protein
LDIVDVTGVHVVDVEGRVNKVRLDKDGNSLGHKEMVLILSRSHFILLITYEYR